MVLDASVAIELLLNTARGERIGRRLAADDEIVHVPHLVDVEVANVLRRYVSRGELD